jgi:thiamine pyrophosphokinase
MYQNIVITSGGRLGNEEFFRKKVAQTAGSFLICCDGGARHVAAAGMIPDVLIGDMDSVESARLEGYISQGVKIVSYPVDKDFTDTELALDYAISLKPETIHIWGALGGRIDHALANIFLLLKGKEAGIETYLIDEYCEIVVTENEVSYMDAAGCLVSLLALSPKVEGLTLRGFLYPLADETLIMGESRGVSNIVKDGQATICLRSGNLLVIRYWQQDVFPEVL